MRPPSWSVRLVGALYVVAGGYVVLSSVGAYYHALGLGSRTEVLAPYGLGVAVGLGLIGVAVGILRGSRSAQIVGLLISVLAALAALGILLFVLALPSNVPAGDPVLTGTILVYAAVLVAAVACAAVLIGVMRGGRTSRHDKRRDGHEGPP